MRGWSQRPYVTEIQLLKMASRDRRRFLDIPWFWIPDTGMAVLWNAQILRTSHHRRRFGSCAPAVRGGWGS